MALELTERQIAMLAEMGVRVWSSPKGRGQNTGAVMPEPCGSDADPIQPPAVGTWQALEAAVGSCQACGFCGQGGGIWRPQQVRTGTWMVVVDTPSETAAMRGEEGLLQDRMLKAVGRSRLGEGEQGAYLTAAVKCGPVAGKVLGAAEVDACREHLRHEVRLLRPRVILGMGRFTVQALVGTQRPLGSLRGQVHAFEGVPVVVTYPVAFLLRHPLEKSKAWADLCLAADIG